MRLTIDELGARPQQIDEAFTNPNKNVQMNDFCHVLTQVGYNNRVRMGLNSMIIDWREHRLSSLDSLWEIIDIPLEVRSPTYMR